MANENNKIPCGGFYLGDGLTMDGNTLKSSGEKQVQRTLCYHRHETCPKHEQQQR